MANVLASFMQGYQATRGASEDAQDMADQRRLRTLAPSAVTGDPQALAQAAAIDPAAAAQFGTQRDDLLTRTRSAAQYLKTALSAGDPAAIAAARQQIKPFMDTLHPEKTPYPLDMDPAQELAGIDAFLGQTANLGDAAGDLKSLRVGQDGYYYAISGNQLVNTGIQAAQNLRPLDLGQAGFVGFDPRTGQAAPVTQGQQQSAPTIFRDATGEFLDVSQVEDPVVRDQIIASPESFGPTVDSVELPGQVVGQFSAGAQPLRRVEALTPYQQAQLAGQARDDARADAAAADAREARQAAVDARRAVTDQKARQAQQAIDVRAAQLNDVRRGVDRVRAALDALDRSRVGTGPLAQFGQQYMEAGQELETAVNAMNNSMLALTRVPGMGAQSDLEARIASMRFPQLGREESVNRRTLQDLEQFVNELAGTARAADNEDRRTLQSEPAAGGTDVDDLLEKYR